MRNELASLYRRLRLPVQIIQRLGLGSEQLKLALHLAGYGLSPGSDERIHLEAALQWLCRAQDACGGAGVSAVYDFRSGWHVAYPETSGYIIATFLAYGEMTGDRSYLERARQIADWEVAIQTPGGGVLSNPRYAYTRVFNTGQVILGWCALFERTGQESYLDAAKRAGNYLADLQEQDGSWVKDTFCGARTYHARVDWSLLRLAALSRDDRYAETASRNLAWVLRQQQDTGWFASCGFHDDDPIMHVIVYTLRGLLECHLTGAPAIRSLNILRSVVAAADPLCAAIRTHAVRGIPWMVPRSFDRSWTSRDQDSCLTGNVQLACFLYRLSRVTGNGEAYREVADRVLEVTRRTQDVTTPIKEVRGALPGSFPFTQGYHAGSYPNWATKFLADALMMRQDYDAGRSVAA